MRKVHGKRRQSGLRSGGDWVENSCKLSRARREQGKLALIDCEWIDKVHELRKKPDDSKQSTGHFNEVSETLANRIHFLCGDSGIIQCGFISVDMWI